MSEEEDFNEIIKYIFLLDIYNLIPRAFLLLFSWIENPWERGGLFFKFKMRQAVSP